MNKDQKSARQQTAHHRGTFIVRTIELANPRLIGVWRWNFDEINERLYVITVFAPAVLRDDYPLEELHVLQDYMEKKTQSVERMIQWARAQLEASGLKEGEAAGTECLRAEIRTPLAGAYTQLFVRADVALRLLDSLWLQGSLGERGHKERTTAMRRTALGVRTEVRRISARLRREIRERYGSPTIADGKGSSEHPSHTLLRPCHGRHT